MFTKLIFIEDWLKELLQSEEDEERNEESGLANLFQQRSEKSSKYQLDSSKLSKLRDEKIFENKKQTKQRMDQIIESKNYRIQQLEQQKLMY